ncbi:hypothetical protein [Actinoplanes sp. NPDC051411]
MIVIDMLGVGRAADRAHTALHCKKRVDEVLPDAVTTPQVVFP